MNYALKAPKWVTMMPKWATQMLKLACCLRFVARKSGGFNAKTILLAFMKLKKAKIKAFMKLTPGL